MTNSSSKMHFKTNWAPCLPHTKHSTHSTTQRFASKYVKLLYSEKIATKGKWELKKKNLFINFVYPESPIKSFAEYFKNKYVVFYKGKIIP